MSKETQLARKPGEVTTLDRAGPFDLTAMQMMADKIPQLQEFMNKNLKQGVKADWEYAHLIWKRQLKRDEEPKAALLDPGVAKIMNYMQMRPRHRIIEKEIDTKTNNLRYVVAVEIVPYVPIMYHNPITNGMEPYFPVVAEGVGSATTREKRYRVSFEYFKERDLKAQGWTEEEFQKFAADNTADFVKGEAPTRLFYLPTAESLGADNTILKMACKRCLGSTTPLLVKTGRHICRTNASNLYDIYNSSQDPVYLPGRNGEWRMILGMTREENRSVIAIKLRSGETIRATTKHEFPTLEGDLKAVSEFETGDSLVRSRIVIPTLDGDGADPKYGWAVGLFIAEGEFTDNEKSVRFTLHKKEVDYVDRLEALAKPLGCVTTVYPKKGKCISVRIFGRGFAGLLSQFVNGDSCYNKTLSKFTWSQSKAFLQEVLQGYLDGDSFESHRRKTIKWPLGFTGENYELQHDLRCLCAILNKRIKIIRDRAKLKDKVYSVFRGWITDTVESYNQAELEKIESIEEETKLAVVYDIDVDGDNIFLLASGIESHNSEMDAVFQLPGVAGRYSQEIDLKEDRGEEVKPPTSPIVPPEKERSTPPYSAPPVAQGPISTPPSTSPLPAEKPNLKSVDLKDPVEKIIAEIQAVNKGLSRAQILAKIGEEKAKAAGLLTDEAAAYLVKDSLVPSSGFKSAAELPKVPEDFRLSEEAGYAIDFIVENFGQQLETVRALVWRAMNEAEPHLSDVEAVKVVREGFEKHSKSLEEDITDTVYDALQKAALDGEIVEAMEDGTYKPKQFLKDRWTDYNIVMRGLGFNWVRNGPNGYWRKV